MKLPIGLINNVNVGILDSALKRFKDSDEIKSKIRFKRCFRILQLEQATNNLNRSVKHDFWFLFMLLVDFMYICK